MQKGEFRLRTSGETSESRLHVSCFFADKEGVVGCSVEGGGIRAGVVRMARAWQAWGPGEAGALQSPRLWPAWLQLDYEGPCATWSTHLVEHF